MNFDGFTAEQKTGVLDLLVLGMYSDGHLAKAEDARIVKLMQTLGYTSKYDCQREFDAAVTRVSRHSKSTKDAIAYATELAGGFSSPDQRKQVHALLSDLMACDAQVSEKETRFLCVVRDVFHM